VPLLAPGFGAQGHSRPTSGVFSATLQAVIASESRSILSAGPEGLAARIEERAALYRGGSHG
jgi:orotidine-5'-phosphate decarboxylase